MLPLTVMFSKNNDPAPIHSGGRESKRRGEEERTQTKHQAFLSALRQWPGPKPLSLSRQAAQSCLSWRKTAMALAIPGTSSFSWGPSCLSATLPHGSQSRPLTADVLQGQGALPTTAATSSRQGKEPLGPDQRAFLKPRPFPEVRLPKVLEWVSLPASLVSSP